MKKTRQANLELLRLLAMVFVVTAHLMNHGNLIGAAKRGTASYYLVWTLFGVSFTCINLYLLISSYFLTEIEIQPLEACKTGGSGTVLCLGNYGDLLDFYRCTP